jgi:hypothetical protein
VIYHSQSRGDIEIEKMDQYHLPGAIKKLRRERNAAEKMGTPEAFKQKAELAEMERVAAEKGVVVEP